MLGENSFEIEKNIPRTEEEADAILKKEMISSCRNTLPVPLSNDYKIYSLKKIPNDVLIEYYNQCYLFFEIMDKKYNISERDKNKYKHTLLSNKIDECTIKKHIVLKFQDRLKNKLHSRGVYVIDTEQINCVKNEGLKNIPLEDLKKEYNKIRALSAELSLEKKLSLDNKQYLQKLDVKEKALINLINEKKNEWKKYKTDTNYKDIEENYEDKEEVKLKEFDLSGKWIREMQELKMPLRRKVERQHNYYDLMKQTALEKKQKEQKIRDELKKKKEEMEDYTKKFKEYMNEAHRHNYELKKQNREIREKIEKRKKEFQKLPVEEIDTDKVNENFEKTLRNYKANTDLKKLQKDISVKK